SFRRRDRSRARAFPWRASWIRARSSDRRDGNADEGSDRRDQDAEIPGGLLHPACPRMVAWWPARAACQTMVDRLHCSHHTTKVPCRRRNGRFEARDIVSLIPCRKSRWPCSIAERRGDHGKGASGRAEGSLRREDVVVEDGDVPAE